MHYIERQDDQSLRNLSFRNWTRGYYTMDQFWQQILQNLSLFCSPCFGKIILNISFIKLQSITKSPNQPTNQPNRKNLPPQISMGSQRSTWMRVFIWSKIFPPILKFHFLIHSAQSQYIHCINWTYCKIKQ